ncbi:MAG TPA: TIR domain-containing protein, partial [Sphingorhabdus sp.]|nr:TIR domain-containing protein [Sphingorhabdus sp.]
MGDASDIGTGDNAGQGRVDTRRFAAFISYSHADADAAATLQRKLERYRLPKHIAQQRVDGTTALGPIFRDREDLAAAASLSAAIRDAIARADALVVMCSPEAAVSPWVTAEIELFRQLHPDRPILAVLLSGEPATAFPAALTAGGNEPLAADLRAEGDGGQLAFLKIVAGIAGVPLDALIQRDAQRRIRRVTAITGGAVAAMLIMGIMTAYAIQARNEAARQRAAAEGLVEYMLTDLREKLKGVNRIEVLDSVTDRAMAHYRSQGDLANLPADSLERRARILHAMGEDADRRGNLKSAAAKFLEAHRTTAAILARQPDVADRIFSHAQSEYWVGYAAWRSEDIPTTERYWRNYLVQAKRLAVIEPGMSRSLMELGYAHGNMCDVLMKDKKDVKRALDHCHQAIVHVRKASV